MAAEPGNCYNPNGPSEKPIDWKLFEELCNLQCTQSEIAAVLKINVDTLRDRSRLHYKENDYSIIYKRFSESGFTSLRRYQFVQSKKNCSMAIWLGKQWLGQKDHEDNDRSPKQDDLNLKNILYKVMHENEQLKKALDDLKPKTSPELQSSDSQV